MTLPAITQKQQEIVTYLPRFRFLDRIHFQHLLQHKDKRRINTWLKDLTEKHYISRLYDDRIIGKKKVAAIYYLDKNGVRFNRDLEIYDENLIHKLYYDRDRSDSFISQSLLITTMCCGLENKNSEDVTYEYFTESDFSQTNNPFYFLKENELPVDLVFSKKQKGIKKIHYLVFIFSQSLPQYRLRKRVRSIVDFYENNFWEDNIDSSFPTLLLICETKALLIYAKRYAKTLLKENEVDGLAFHFTTTDDARENGLTGEIWEKVE